MDNVYIIETHIYSEYKGKRFSICGVYKSLDMAKEDLFAMYNVNKGDYKECSIDDTNSYFCLQDGDDPIDDAYMTASIIKRELIEY